MRSTVSPPPRADAQIASWIELDARAFAQNLAIFDQILGPKTRTGVVLKGDAYGHGLLESLPLLHAHTAWIFVITLADALLIRAWEREQGADPAHLVILGALAPAEVVRAAQADVRVVISNLSFEHAAKAVAEAHVTLHAHLHIETGLSREGVAEAEFSRALAWLDDVGAHVQIEGAMMHFADVEDVTEQRFALQQLDAFTRASTALDAFLHAHHRPPVALRHTAASAACLALPQARLDLVRIGIALYGLWPSRESRLSARLMLGHVPELHPVLSWRVPIQLLKTVQAGACVGYGQTWVAARESTLAVLPVGYFDGYPRALGNHAHVLVRGRRVPVVGRVAMNHVICDVTDVSEATEGDIVTLIGHDGEASVSVEELASLLGTITYEITTRIGAHLPRVVRPKTPQA